MERRREESKQLNILDTIRNLGREADGRVCLNKTMLRKETEFEEVMRCDHSYDKRCHTTYFTDYVPHYQQECQEKFRKVCVISYQQKAVTEMVEECTIPLVPNCEKKDIPEVCRTIYDTVCHNEVESQEVEEQFPNCTTVNIKKNGEVWPVQQCSVETRTVTRSVPRTGCRKEPRELCAPGDCPIIEVGISLLFINCESYISQGERICVQKMKTVVVDSPEEECDMEPQQVCGQVTILVPQLKAKEECVDVPKEVCSVSKLKPLIKRVPFIQKWCFNPEDEENLTHLIKPGLLP